MRVVIFCHSLASCWNHGNAHFLRGVVRELAGLGHEVRVLEPAAGWSRQNLVRDHGEAALEGWRAACPGMEPVLYEGELPDLDAALEGADLVLVHEWNPPGLVAAVGRHRARGGRYVLLFHDTHHRAVSEPEAIGAFELEAYDGVLAFGAVLRERYLERGWGRRAWVWHEAADTALFRPMPEIAPVGDLVWIGNWGDGERSVELGEFLLEPVRRLGLDATVHGVRYPADALAALEESGLVYQGWLPNHEAPRVFARHRVTVHVPRRPYVAMLPGIPTIRVFEALACGIPLVCAPWRDEEGLFPEGAWLTARNGDEMTRQLRDVLTDEALRQELVATGLAAIRERHSCAHRVAELLDIHAEIAGPAAGRHEEIAGPAAAGEEKRRCA
ncbi:glycosyltransferase [Geminicoccaceae bacterium 1502E]|nr:glycosyltransferase [Geminicoccaceae bacterium 1502E]